jgi:putative ABC transport system permease protein
MIKSYFIIAFRNMMKQKAYSMITISGLVLGLSMFILFALFSDHLSNFDMFNNNIDRIYSVVQVQYGGGDDKQHSAITPAPLIQALVNEFPEIEKASRYFPPGKMIVKYEDNIFYENGVKFVDPSFLSIFSFDLTIGNKETVLSKPYSIVLTEDSKIKYFGDENPIGKSLTLENQIEVTVTGITENVPSNSSLRFDFLVSMETAKNFYGHIDDWNENKYASFILLSEGINVSKVENKFPDFIQKYYKESSSTPQQYYLHPMSKFYFESKNIDSYWGKGGASFIVLWIIASLLLIIACINFMNLLTARYITRANEVGMRKVIGASRSQLIKQFIGESMFMSIISLPLAILLFEIIKPIFIAYVGDIFHLSLWESPKILILVTIVTLLTGLFSGSYPAFYLSSFKPLKALKGNIKSGRKGSRLRKTLVAVQFMFSIVLIIMTIANIMQSKHNQNVDLGFNRNNIITVQIQGDAKKNLGVLKEELAKYNEVASVTSSASLPASWKDEKMILPEGVDENETIKMNVYGIGENFIETLEIKLLYGRMFSKEYDDNNNFIINEKALMKLPWKDPVGKQITIDEKTGTIIGVVKDYHFTSIYFKRSSPAIFCMEQENLNYLLVKTLSGSNNTEVNEFIEKQWAVLNPFLPLVTETLENYYFDSNISGDKTSEITGIIGVIAIFLSCLGLLALSSYSVERKIKEIGIRKVLGASVSSITNMLTKEFLFVVLISNIIAIPIAYLLVNNFFQFLYAYPVPIGPEIFIATIIGTLLISFLTVTSQTFKAAHMNPVDNLRDE